MLLEPRPLLRKVFLNRLLIIQRIQVQVLIIRHDEDEIWFLGNARDGGHAHREEHQCLAWCHCCWCLAPNCPLQNEIKSANKISAIKLEVLAKKKQMLVRKNVHPIFIARMQYLIACFGSGLGLFVIDPLKCILRCWLGPKL